jgi:hypothetical protein
MRDEIYTDRLLGVVTCTCGNRIEVWSASYRGGVGIALEVIEALPSQTDSRSDHGHASPLMICPIPEASGEQSRGDAEVRAETERDGDDSPA